MIRFLLRFLGLVALAAAFIFFIYDGVRFIANRQIDFTTVAYVWNIVNRSSLLAFQTTVGQRLTPAVWTSVIEPYFLRQPTCLILAIVGAILLLLGRRKKPLIGYSR